MCLVIVKFSSEYVSTIVDGRMPFFEYGRKSAVYLVPEDSVTMFSSDAMQNGALQVTIYRYWKTIK